MNRARKTIDATDQSLGRVATQVAVFLRGKHKPTFSPHLDEGDYVTVINAAKMKVTGKKMEQKVYRRHSLQPGGLKISRLKKLWVEDIEQVLILAVRRMIPSTRLRIDIMKRLTIKR